MAYTGGPLNELNGKMGISAPHKSVPVMKLIRVHKPRSKEELVDLIEYHYINECSCGIKSKGTVRDFGKNLYEAQINYWGEYRYSLKDCIQWEYDLFIVQSMKGGIIEKKALSLISSLLPGYTIQEAEGFLDEELRVDLVIKDQNRIKAGIQVKPLTFNRMRPEVIEFNKVRNSKWGILVLYLFYDEEENFTNLNKLKSEFLENM
jgi:hypothetical protein